MQVVSIPPVKTLEKAFAGSGARFVSCEVYLTGKLGGSLSGDIDALRGLALEIAGGLGAVRGELSCSTSERGNLTEIDVSSPVGVSRNVDIKAAMDKIDAEGYITASVQDNSGNPSLEGVAENAGRILVKSGVDPRVNACIVGSFPGRLSEKELSQVLERVLQGADAQRVEGMAEGGLTSVSAYSPAIGQSVEINGSIINLNVAARYNSFEDRTYIWLATPVITTEY